MYGTIEYTVSWLAGSHVFKGQECNKAAHELAGWVICVSRERSKVLKNVRILLLTICQLCSNTTTEIFI